MYWPVLYFVCISEECVSTGITKQLHTFLLLQLVLLYTAHVTELFPPFLLLFFVFGDQLKNAYS